MTTLTVFPPAVIDRSRVCDVGLDLADVELTWEQAVEIRDDIARAEKAVQWWWVDWVNRIAELFPHEYTQLLPLPDELDDYKKSTYYSWAYVGRKFPIEKRRPELTFSHHVEVCSIEDVTKREEFLDDAVRCEFTVRQLRQEVINYKRRLVGEEGAEDRALPAPGPDDEAGAIPMISIHRSVPALRTVAYELSIPERMALVRGIVADMQEDSGLPQDDDFVIPTGASDNPYVRAHTMLDRAYQLLPGDVPASYEQAFRRLVKWMSEKMEV